MNETTTTDELFLSHQGLVRAVAWKLHRRAPHHVELDDLIAYGQIGLLQAIERFNETRGLKFATFAWHRVRGAILDGLGKMAWFDRIAFEKGTYELPSNEIDAEVPHCNAKPTRCSFDEADLLGQSTPPLANLEKREAIAFLMSLVADLPPKEAGLLRGVFFEGRTLSESARRLGISTAWASRLQNRTLADLRLALERHGLA